MANMFDENGNYNKTEWKPGDRIAAGKLNKIEDALEAINNNDIERHKEADERLDALEEQNEAVEERFDELEDLVADNKSEVDTAIYEVHSKMDRLEQEMNDGIDTVEAIAHTVDDKIAEADAGMKAQVAEVEADLEGLHAKDEELSEQLAHIEKKVIGIINVKNFGAVGDGITDDTQAIQTALNFETNDFRHVYIPDGEYLINQVSKLRLKSNTSLEFSQNAKLVAMEQNHDIYSMLDVVNVENIEIINPTLVGDREYNSKTNGGAGHGISCRGVKNLKITGAKCSNCFTDGIYLGGVENGLVEFFNCDNNRRQGISITNCDNLVLRNGVCSNTNGTSPEMGIDIEPNFETDKLKGLVLDNIQTINNNSSGIGINLTRQAGEDNIVDIVITNCKDNGSGKGLTFANYGNDMNENGVIYVDNFRTYYTKECGIAVAGYKGDKAPKIILNKPYVYSPNMIQGTHERGQNVGISIHSDVSTWTSGTIQGNVDIINPTILVDTVPLLRGIYVGYGGNAQNIRIIDPFKIDIGESNTLSNNSSKNLLTLYGEPSVEITDAYKVLEVSTDAPLIRNYGSSIYSKIIGLYRAYATSVKDFLYWKYVNECMVISETTVLNVVLPENVTFYQNGNEVSGTITCTGNGCINFKKITSTSFNIEYVYGNWNFLNS